jgi:hypothetical protein
MAGRLAAALGCAAAGFIPGGLPLPVQSGASRTDGTGLNGCRRWQASATDLANIRACLNFPMDPAATQRAADVRLGLKDLQLVER